MVLISSLSNSLTGMKAAQSQLDIISRNIANADTPGYTRKTAQQNNVVRSGYLMGVAMGDITRKVDEGLLKSYLASNALTSNYSARHDFLSKAELTLGTPEGSNSLAANMSSLQQAMETFATDITSSASRYTLLNQASTLTSRLNSISSEIQKLRGDADMEINSTVMRVNELLDTLDDLNDEIVKYGLLNYDGTADLLDERDQALRELSGLLDISYFTRDTGAIVIQTTGGTLLLDSDPHKLMHNAITQADATTSYAGGEISGIYVDGKDITGTIKDGALKGLLDIRDTTLPSLQSQLDELAHGLIEQINQVHNRGTAYPDTPDTLTGSRTFIHDTDGKYPQKIRIEQGDVRFIVFDSEGTQLTSVTLKDGLGFEEGSISDMADKLQEWLRSEDGANLPQAEVYLNNEGKLVIKTGDSEYGLSIIDTATSAAGTEQKDAVIKFDAGNNDTFAQTYEGFSSFFGLNDMLVGHGNDYIYDSKVLSPHANLGLDGMAIWSFSDSVNGFSFGTLTISPNDTIMTIADKINRDPILGNALHALLVPNGSGYMLRIENRNGEQLEITETQGNGLMERMGMEVSSVASAQTIQVRDDIMTNAGLISGGAA